MEASGMDMSQLGGMGGLPGMGGMPQADPRALPGGRGGGGNPSQLTPLRQPSQKKARPEHSKHERPTGGKRRKKR
jgi:hypothetical protein